MITVKFDKSVKYKGVRYPAHVVFEADDADIKALKKCGAIVMGKLADGEHPATDNPPASGTAENKQDVAYIKEQLLEFTVSQLTKFAKDYGIDLQGKTRKADIYNVIVANLD